MSSKEIDKLLSGIIIILLIVVVWKWFQDRGSCSKSRLLLSCGCEHGKCRCRGVAQVPVPRANNSGGCQRPAIRKEYMTDAGAEVHGDYSSVIEEMSLEDSVKESQGKYVESLEVNKLAQGASHNTIAEETGRSYGTADFHGLTQRKWDMVRCQTEVGDDARSVPTYEEKKSRESDCARLLQNNNCLI